MHKNDVSALLNRPHFQADNTSQLPPDPAIATRIRVNLDQLVPYAGNPRVSKNPKHHEIKESIRNSGLDHSPNITRQNPADPYMIKDGGNTRLAILNELWQETQDLRFFELDCIFYPWTNEVDVLVRHMRENEMRGDMLFIERAIAAVKIRVNLEAEETKPFSIRELAKRITALGWTIDHVDLNQLVYAHDNLYPIIPNFFWAGNGRDTVRKIRKMLDNAGTFWESVATEDEGSFEQIWQSVFMLLDSEDFDLNDAQNQLEAEIAQRIDSPMMSVRGEIQAIAQGISPGGIRPSNVLTIPDRNFGAGTHINTLPASIPSRNDINNSASAQPQTDLKPAQKALEKSTEDIKASPISNNTNEPELIHPQPIIQASSSTLRGLLNYTTEELMNNAFGLAGEYATHFGFESCIAFPNDHGFNGHDGFHSGFILLQPTKEVESVAFANPNVYLNYLYLFQLSNWFCLDHDDPSMHLVSTNSLLKWIAKEDIEHASRSTIHMRAYSLAMHVQGSGEGRAYVVMDELETCIGILIARFAAHIGQGT